MSHYLGIRLRRIRRLRALAQARMKRISRRGNSIAFDRYAARSRYRYRYALQALEPAWIPVRQIETGRRTIKRCVRLFGKTQKVFSSSLSLPAVYLLDPVKEIITLYFMTQETQKIKFMLQNIIPKQNRSITRNRCLNVSF